MSERAFYSIVTVSLNNLEGLKATADSVLSQSCANYEWIVVDGGSIDGTQDYLKMIEAYVVSEPDAGIYDAMNKGIEKARGRYLIFMNAGDTFANNGVLKAVLNAAKNCAIWPDFIYGDAEELLLNGKRFFKKARSWKALNSGMFTHHQSMFYSRDIVQHLRYDLRYKIAADYDFTLRVLHALNVENILYIPQAICLFEAGGVSQRNAKTGRHEQFEIRKKLKVLSVFENWRIRVLQFVNWNARRFVPWLYWFSKR